MYEAEYQTAEIEEEDNNIKEMKLFWEKHNIETLSELIRQEEDNNIKEMKLFWENHNVETLSELIRQANPVHVKCKCCGCIVSGRWIEDSGSENPWTCLFAAWLETQILNCGMLIERGSMQNKCIMGHDCNPTKWVIDSDVHFIRKADAHMPSQEGTKWRYFTYGSKIFNATSVNDPEIRKLKKLFEILGGTQN